MKSIKLQSENPNGLHQRYKITKANGEPTDPNATYFVLRLDNGGSDPTHIRACRQATLAYATVILTDEDAKHLHKTASELVQLINHQKGDEE